MKFAFIALLISIGASSAHAQTIQGNGSIGSASMAKTLELKGNDALAVVSLMKAGNFPALEGTYECIDGTQYAHRSIPREKYCTFMNFQTLQSELQQIANSTSEALVDGFISGGFQLPHVGQFKGTFSCSEGSNVECRFYDNFGSRAYEQSLNEKEYSRAYRAAHPGMF